MGVLTAAWFYIPTLFPLPEPNLAEIYPTEYATERFRLLILHHLIYTGIFLVGLGMIFSKLLRILPNHVIQVTEKHSAMTRPNQSENEPTSTRETTEQFVIFIESLFNVSSQLSL